MVFTQSIINKMVLLQICKTRTFDVATCVNINISTRQKYLIPSIVKSRCLQATNRRDAASTSCDLARQGVCKQQIGETRRLQAAIWRDKVSASCNLARQGVCKQRFGETRRLQTAIWRDTGDLVRNGVCKSNKSARRGVCKLRFGETRCLQAAIWRDTTSASNKPARQLHSAMTRIDA